MPHPAFCGLRPVLNLGEQLRFNPDALVRNPFGVGLRLPDSGAALISNDNLKKAVALGGNVPSGVGVYWTVLQAHNCPIFGT
jgi:hypothetical protein